MNEQEKEARLQFSQFCERLEEARTNFVWHWERRIGLRGHRRGLRFCPLTAVHFHLTNDYVPIGTRFHDSGLFGAHAVANLHGWGEVSSVILSACDEMRPRMIAAKIFGICGIDMTACVR